MGELSEVLIMTGAMTYNYSEKEISSLQKKHILKQCKERCSFNIANTLYI